MVTPMRVLLLNPAHPAVSSRCHHGQMPPLGLLAVGGALIDAGHEVRLIDAEIGPMTTSQIISAATAWAPDAILIGHSGSTSAHPVIVEIARALKIASVDVPIIYGGVYPTYHASDILEAHCEIDVIVRGEGEATTTTLLAAMQRGNSIRNIPGIAYRHQNQARVTAAAPMIDDLNRYRVGWELIENWDRYQYWARDALR